MPYTPRVRRTLALLLLALPALAAPAEFRYLDEPDDAKAADMLPALLKKHGDARKCDALLKLLRTKGSYPARVPDRQTLDYACSDGKTRQFTVLLPKGYSRRKPTGVLFFLHGAIRQPAPGGGANEASMFQPAVRDLGVIVVGPSTYEGVEWGSPPCRELVRHALGWVKRNCNVDENRVYVAGDSDGGRGTYALAETESTFFAAAVPVIGAPGGVTRFANLRNLPWFAINGETDGLFKIDRVREAVGGMKASGIDIELKVVPGVGHDPRLFLTYKDEVCDFLKKHSREPFPEVVYGQMDPDAEPAFPANTFRWIRIDAFGDTPGRADFDDAPGSLLRSVHVRIEARRTGNRIDVKARGVGAYTVLVAEGMVDVDAEIEVFTNGRSSFRGRVEPDARVILEEARRFRDRHLLFASRIRVDLAADGE